MNVERIVILILSPSIYEHDIFSSSKSVLSFQSCTIFKNLSLNISMYFVVNAVESGMVLKCIILICVCV